MNIQKVPIEKVKPWAENPRGIKTKDYERLKRQMLELGVYKPLVCVKENGHYTVLGGNMRIRALKEIGIKEVEISIVTAKTKAQKIKYALSDNDGAGFYEEQALAELVYPHLAEIKLEDFKVDLGEAIDLKQVVERLVPNLDGSEDVPHASLEERFLVPPFSVLDARQGYWQARKDAWLALGIKSELGRGGGLTMSAEQVTTENLNYYRNRTGGGQRMCAIVNQDKLRRLQAGR